MVMPASVREALQAEGIDAAVINARFVKPIDAELILRYAQKTGYLLTVEDHVQHGGFGSAVLEVLADHGVCGVTVLRHALPMTSLNTARKSCCGAISGWMRPVLPHRSAHSMAVGSNERSSLRCIMTECGAPQQGVQTEQRSRAGDEVELCMSRSTERTRLDLLVWQRGLAPSRAQAQGLVLAGKIAVNGQCITRAGTPVEPQAVITRLGNVRAMSVGVEKSWLRRWRHSPSTSANVSPWMWASTGGFTDCLLQAGVVRVYAVDVGYGQLHWRLRNDPRVIVYERTNVRYLNPQELPSF